MLKLRSKVLCGLLGLSLVTLGGFTAPKQSEAADKPIIWKMQSVSPSGSKEFKWMPEAFAKNVETLSGGRLKIELHPAGALMKSDQVPEAVSKGALDVAHTYVSYFGGRVAGFNSASEWPFDAHPLQAVMWFYEGGGDKIMREFGVPHNIYFLGVSPFLPEYVQSKKPINRLADLKGVKMRAQAVGGEMFALLGASVVTMPGEEIYPALQRGILDATEYLSISPNYDYKLHEVTEYIITPTYSGGQSIDWIINMKSWDKLPADLKEIVDLALRATNFDYWNKAVPDEKAVWAQLVEKNNMKVIVWPKEDVDAMFEARRQVIQDKAAKSPDYKRRVDSQLKWAKESLGINLD